MNFVNGHSQPDNGDGSFLPGCIIVILLCVVFWQGCRRESSIDIESAHRRIDRLERRIDTLEFKLEGRK